MLSCLEDRVAGNGRTEKIQDVQRRLRFVVPVGDADGRSKCALHDYHFSVSFTENPAAGHGSGST